MSLHLGIYESATGNMWRNLSGIARGLKFSANRHGFLNLSCEAPMSLIDSFQFFDRPGLPHVEVNWNGIVAWAGRLEDPAVLAGGVRVGALGYQRALWDVPYTALWSNTQVADWVIVPETWKSDARPDRFTFDNNNRLYVTPQKGSVHGTTTSPKVGFWGFEIPSGSARQIVAISFDYAFLAPSNWVGALSTFTGSLSSPTFSTSPWSVNGSGALQTGTQTLTFTACDAVMFYLYFNAADATYTPETGDNYLRITNVRVKTTTSASLYADEIAKALVAYVNGINSTQLSSTVARIESPALDLKDEVYEDLMPGDILEHLVGLGDSATPPLRWEWAVWESQQLALRARASQAQEWFVDVGAPDMERTLDLLQNSAYAVYQDASGRTLRTAVSADTFSTSRYAITRRAAVPASTTSATQAASHRDAFLQDRKDPTPRAGLTFSDLFDQFGNRWPPWILRPGHTVTARNLPATLGPSVDRIRSFVVDETEYFAETRQGKAVPETPLASLETVVVENNDRRSNDRR